MSGPPYRKSKKSSSSLLTYQQSLTVFLSVVLLELFFCCLKAYSDGISWLEIPTSFTTEKVAIFTMLLSGGALIACVSLCRYRDRKFSTFFVVLGMLLVLYAPVFFWNETTLQRLTPKVIDSGETMRLVSTMPTFYHWAMGSLERGSFVLFIAGINDSFSVFKYSLCYVLSLYVEASILLFCLSKNISCRKRLAAGFWLTSITFPVVNLFFPRLYFLSSNPLLLQLTSEVAAIISECILFALIFEKIEQSKRERLHNLLVIVLANLASYIAGYAFNISP